MGVKDILMCTKQDVKYYLEIFVVVVLQNLNRLQEKTSTKMVSLPPVS